MHDTKDYTGAFKGWFLHKSPIIGGTFAERDPLLKGHPEHFRHTVLNAIYQKNTELVRFCVFVCIWYVCVYIYTHIYICVYIYICIYRFIYILNSYVSSPKRRDVNQRPWGARFPISCIYIYFIRDVLCRCVWVYVTCWSFHRKAHPFADT